MALKLIHTADWQIGTRYDFIPGDAGALLRQQRLKTIEQVARLASEHEADAVLVAGDVFEMNSVADDTLRRTLNALTPYPGPWLLLPGNHDAALSESAWTRLRRMGVPDNVHLLTRPEPVCLLDGRLAVLPAPLQRRHETRDLTAWFETAETAAGCHRIGLAHGTAAGRLPEAAETHNVIPHDLAARARLDYLALGDWHGTLEIDARCWYAGTPETDRFRENDSGNVLLVALEEPGATPRVTRLPTSHYQWVTLKQSLTADSDLETLGTHLEGLTPPTDRLVVQLTLTGQLGLGQHRALDELLAEWGARVRYLDTDRSGLGVLPSDEDIAGLETEGFLADAVERLRALCREGDPAERVRAQDALRRLYGLLHAGGR